MSYQLTELMRDIGRFAPYETFEELLTDPDGFGLTTASPVQRAIARAIEGRPLGDLWDDPEVRKAFGDFGAFLLEEPDEVLITTGIRSGKSLIAGAIGVHMTQTCVLAMPSGAPLGVGDLVRVSILSVKKELAEQVFEHITKHMMQSSFLRSLIIGEPKTDSLLVRHPTGKPIEIKIIANTRAGASLVSRWSAGAIFDEAARMQGQEEGVVNLPDARKAVRHRLLRNSKIVYVTSKWRPTGEVHKWETTEHGKPGKRLVVSCPADVMNPVGWTPEVVAQRYLDDPEGARVELGNEYEDPESMLYPPELMRRLERSFPVIAPRDFACRYTAAIDPATRGNAWTLAVLTKKDHKVVLAYAHEWRGTKSEPLDPDVVLKEIKSICADYGLEFALTDSYAPEFVRKCALHNGLGLIPRDFRGAERAAVYMSFARRIEAGLVEFGPSENHYFARVQADLAGVRKKTKANGGIEIKLPTTVDGRHSDFAPSIVAAAEEYMDELPRELTKKASVTDDEQEDKAIEEKEAQAHGGDEELEYASEDWYSY